MEILLLNSIHNMTRVPKGEGSFKLQQFQLIWNKDKISDGQRVALTQGLIDTAESEEEIIFLKHWLEGYYKFSQSYIPINSKERFQIIKRIGQTQHKFQGSSQDSVYANEIQVIDNFQIENQQNDPKRIKQRDFQFTQQIHELQDSISEQTGNVQQQTKYYSAIFKILQFKFLWNKDFLSDKQSKVLTQGLIETARSDEEFLFLKHWLEGFYKYPKQYAPIKPEERFLIIKRLGYTQFRFEGCSQDQMLENEISLFETEQDDFLFAQQFYGLCDIITEQIGNVKEQTKYYSAIFTIIQFKFLWNKDDLSDYQSQLLMQGLIETARYDEEFLFLKHWLRGQYTNPELYKRLNHSQRWQIIKLLTNTEFKLKQNELVGIFFEEIKLMEGEISEDQFNFALQNLQAQVFNYIESKEQQKQITHHIFTILQFQLLYLKNKLSNRRRKVLTQGLIDTAESEEEIIFLKHWLEGYYKYSQSYIHIDFDEASQIMKLLNRTNYKIKREVIKTWTQKKEEYLILKLDIV